MIVVADSGSTKTDWKVIGTNEVKGINTMGFNPNFHSQDFIVKELKKVFAGEEFMPKADFVQWYGSGCWDTKRKEIIKKALKEIFPKSDIDVAHDLLGAARATCGNTPGISCIIGTGSNSCIYDGKEVTDNVTNLGYLLGDEASGTHLGKKLIQAYYYRELPNDLVTQFKERYPGDKLAILDNVYYSEGTPNVYLASFTKFMADNRNHVYIQQLLYSAFSEFTDRHIRKYKGHLSLPIHFIGSVAYHFQEVIKAVLEERCLKTGIFIQKPIDNLVAFHQTLSN